MDGSYPVYADQVSVTQTVKSAGAYVSGAAPIIKKDRATEYTVEGLILCPDPRHSRDWVKVTAVIWSDEHPGDLPEAVELLLGQHMLDGCPGPHDIIRPTPAMELAEVEYDTMAEERDAIIAEVDQAFEITDEMAVSTSELKTRPEDQPLPIPNDTEDIQSMVIRDITERRELGIKRYGTALQVGNGRDMLQDAYEEALDLAIYLRGCLEEQKIRRALIEEAHERTEDIARKMGILAEPEQTTDFTGLAQP